jgi:alpha-L-fucosidase
MGEEQVIKAFTYLPRQDRKVAGLIDEYIFYVSSNGTDWEVARKGVFSNMEANPVQQLVILEKPLKARYFKFEALHTNHGKGVSVAELGIIVK